MKSFVFSIRRDERKHRPHHFYKSGQFSFNRLFTYYGLHIFFFVVLLVGVIMGASAASKLSPDFLKKLDFLFVTDVKSRLGLSSFSVFCSSLSTNFIFMLCTFLLAFCAWGFLGLPFVCLFKGYGIGVSSAHLFSSYSVSGIGFYILVVLPGVALFLFTFIVSLKESYTSSLGLLKVYFTKKTEYLSQKVINTYLYKNFIILIFTTCCAVVDMLLWMLFANMFNF